MIYGHRDDDLVLELLPHAGLVAMAREAGFQEADMASNRQELMDAILLGTPLQRGRVASARHAMGMVLELDPRVQRLLAGTECGKCYAKGNTLCHDGRAVSEYLSVVAAGVSVKTF